MGKRVAIKDIIQAYKEVEGNVTQAAVLSGVSRWTVLRWVARCQSISQSYTKTYIWRGIKRHSTRPHTIHYKLSHQEISVLLRIKREKHIGAKKIVHVFKTDVSFSTIHRLFKKERLISKQTNYRRPLFQNGRAMRPSNTKALGYLQMDTKHVTPELSGLEYTVYEYASIDIASRYKLAVLLPDISDESAALALQYFLKWFPFEITYIQTDNGLEYQRSFQEFCVKRNIKHYFIHKNSPNENAVIERSFRTDQDEFYHWLEKQPEHIGELNSWLQAFIHEYNTWRPHQSLDYKTPEEVVKVLQMS